MRKWLVLFHIIGNDTRETTPRLAFFFLRLLSLIFLLSLSSAAQSPTKKVVLILSGSDPNHPGFSSFTKALASTVRKESSERVEFLYELQENFVLPPGSHEEDEKTAAYLNQKYGGRKIDLVLCLVAPRFTEFLRVQPGLFKDVPKVFYDFEEQRDAILRESGPHVTGVWAKVDLTETLDIAFKLQPDAKRVVVTAGNSFVDKQMLEQAKAEFRRYEDRVPFTYLTDLTLDELRTRLAALPRDSIVFALTFSSDPTGNKYAGPEVIAAVAPVSGAPIYGVSETNLGSGIVGGSLVDFVLIGNRLGEASLRILSGEKAESIPSQTAPNKAVFDWRELRRWGISEANLPEGSIIQYKQPTVWEEYKWYAIGLLAAVFLEAILIGLLLYLRYRRREAEAESARLHGRLKEIVSNVPGIVWESRTDPAINERRTTFISDYVERMLGYTAEEWLKQPPGFGLQIVAEEERERVLRESDEVIEQGKEAVSEFRWFTKDGRIRWVENHLSPVVDENAGVVGLRGVALDVTDRKAADEKLKEALDQLSQLKNQLEAENIYLQEELRQDQAFGDIIGQSSAIKYVLFKISQVAPTDAAVLITGETGTGKELVARAIHDGSERKDRRLIKVNCAALSPSLIESELFGHERGAFTGAAARKLGRFELANTGTLLLDEIGELPLDLQSKLLRVLQEGEFERVGSGTTIKTDARIIASTNRDLKQAVEKGKFRQDLWYRLNVFPITTPPLRDHRDDIPLLTEHFARTFARKFGKELTAISPAALNDLCTYSWPGNVRELANVIERAIINLRGTVLKIHEDFALREPDMLPASVATLEDMEREHIRRVLEDLNWRIDGPKGAARVLGINPSTLRTRMGKLGISKPNGRPRAKSSEQ